MNGSARSVTRRRATASVGQRRRRWTTWHCLPGRSSADQTRDANGRPVKQWHIRNLCVAALAFSFGCGGAAPPDDTEARTVIERFHEQIRTGNVDAAWEATTADFKSDEGRDAFRRFVKSRPALKQPLEFTELKQVEVNGLTRWEAILHPPAEQKPPAIVKTMIAQEAGIWKIERLVVE
jgi:hypothetical protein